MLLHLPFLWSRIAHTGLRARCEACANHSRSAGMACDVEAYVREQLEDENVTLFDIALGLRQARRRMDATDGTATKTPTKASAPAAMQHAPAQQQGSSAASAAKSDPWHRLPKTEGCVRMARPRPATAPCACATTPASAAACFPAPAPLVMASPVCDAELDPCELQARHALKYQRSQSNWESRSSQGYGYVSLSAGWQPPPGARHLPSHAALERTLGRLVVAKAAGRNAAAVPSTSVALPSTSVPAECERATSAAASASASACFPAPASLTAALPACDAKPCELQARHALEYQRSQGNWEACSSQGYGYVSLSAGWQPPPGARHLPGHAALQSTLGRLVAAKAAGRNAAALPPTFADPIAIAATATHTAEPTGPTAIACSASVQAQQQKEASALSPVPSPAAMPKSLPPPSSVPDADAVHAFPASTTPSSSSSSSSRASSSGGSCASSSAPPTSAFSSSLPASPSSVLRRLLSDMPQPAPTTCMSGAIGLQCGKASTSAVQALLMTA